MVKVINIDTKTKTIRIDNADSDIKTWRTTESGTHFPIKKGESTKEALDKFVAKKQEESPAMRAAREASERMSGLKLAIGDKKNGVKKAQPAKKEDDYDLKFASDIKKGDIVSAGGRDYKIIQADRNWVIGLDDKGLQLKINTEATFDTFKVKKQQPAKKEPELLGDRYDRTHGIKTEKSKEGLLSERKGPEDVDVSDIVKNYKKQMKALGADAPIEKTDRVEADAIKEFMTRKIGANRPYEDYYQYWLNGMDKATKDAFNEIYNESEAREMAFSELASDVDHSGLARGEPTYDELMEWSKKQKAKKAQQQPAKASSEQTKEIDAKIKDKKKELQNIIKSLSENVEDGYFDIAQEMMTDVEYVKGELKQLMDERTKMQQQPAKKESVDMWAKPKSHEGSESFKSAMQETMKSFPRLYDFEKQPLESFAEDIYGKLQENPGKEQAVLDHYVDAYKSYIATLGPWVDTPTLVKKAFLDKMVEQNLEERNQKRREESRWGNAGLGTAFYDLKK